MIAYLLPVRATRLYHITSLKILEATGSPCGISPCNIIQSSRLSVYFLVGIGITTKNSGIIVGVASHEKNEHDSKTLEAALTSAQSNRDKPIQEAICDRGYKGKKEVLGVTISIPAKTLKRDTKYQKEVKREKFRRRAAIEPIIGHLKSDHRMARNYLKGFIGDEINLLLAASAFNLRKWMNNFILFFIALRVAMIIYALREEKPKERQKYLQLFLLLLKLW